MDSPNANHCDASKLVTRILTAVTPLANVQPIFTPTLLVGEVVVVVVVTIGDTVGPAVVD